MQLSTRKSRARLEAMDVKSIIASSLKKVLVDLGTTGVEPQLDVPTEEGHGDYSSNIALAIFSSSKFNPSTKLRTGVQSSKLQSKVKSEVIEKIAQDLNSGIPVRDIKLSEEEKEEIKDLHLITEKQEIIVLNVSEQDYSPKAIEEITQKYKEILRFVQDDNASKIVVICAKIEAELSELSEDEQKEYLKDLGLESSGLERLIQKAYETLGLISFLTAGEKEVRAWTVRLGTTSLTASGVIHTDFMGKFIKAEVVPFEDFVAVGGWKSAREKGKTRLEGKNYIVQDGDVIEFKIGS